MGGLEADYEELICSGEGDGVGYEAKGVNKQDAFPVGAADQVFTDALYYKGTDVMLKINNYVPPMQEELDSTIMALDTWNRET